MSKVNYMILQNSIIVNFEGKNFTISKDDGRYNSILKCIKEERFDDLKTEVDLVSKINQAGFTIEGDKVFVNNEELPQSLASRITGLLELEVSVQPLLNFWDNLKLNPSMRSRDMLFKFLEHNGHPLTEDGCFIAYRKVRADFKDIHSGTFDNQVGSICEMPRDQVDDDPEKTCSKGLHVASCNYLSNYGDRNDPIIEVKVNPKDVVAVPIDYNGTKMRVCKFEVVAVTQIMNTENVYGVKQMKEEMEETKIEQMSTSWDGWRDDNEDDEETDDLRYCEKCGALLDDSDSSRICDACFDSLIDDLEEEYKA